MSLPQIQKGKSTLTSIHKPRRRNRRIRQLLNYSPNLIKTLIKELLDEKVTLHQCWKAMFDKSITPTEKVEENRNLVHVLGKKKRNNLKATLKRILESENMPMELKMTVKEMVEQQAGLLTMGVPEQTSPQLLTQSTQTVEMADRNISVSQMNDIETTSMPTQTQMNTTRRDSAIFCPNLATFCPNLIKILIKELLNERVQLHQHWSDFFKRTNAQQSVPENHFQTVNENTLIHNLKIDERQNLKNAVKAILESGKMPGILQNIVKEMLEEQTATSPALDFNEYKSTLYLTQDQKDILVQKLKAIQWFKPSCAVVKALVQEILQEEEADILKSQECITTVDTEEKTVFNDLKQDANNTDSKIVKVDSNVCQSTKVTDTSECRIEVPLKDGSINSEPKVKNSTVIDVSNGSRLKLPKRKQLQQIRKSYQRLHNYNRNITHKYTRPRKSPFHESLELSNTFTRKVPLRNGSINPQPNLMRNTITDISTGSGFKMPKTQVQQANRRNQQTNWRNQRSDQYNQYTTYNYTTPWPWNNGFHETWESSRLNTFTTKAPGIYKPVSRPQPYRSASIKYINPVSSNFKNTVINSKNQNPVKQEKANVNDTVSTKTSLNIVPLKNIKPCTAIANFQIKKEDTATSQYCVPKMETTTLNHEDIGTNPIVKLEVLLHNIKQEIKTEPELTQNDVE